MNKFAVAVGTVVTFLAVSVGMAYATAPTPVSLATDSGTDFRDTGIAVIAALIPLAVALILAKKALPWARRMLGV